ncbi:hypothetical protein SteCoe_9066 [Stentor coeruleus]|uniref:G-protein coupled receptors family 2 profile 2 domain-containing protein n=1 Tax=Stentor coeruleus TaxID=5963 RepID=A0A1R2CIU3_9CILI|nr:hypothetical protein SteCoe_9066 [Stentor coeruleus]
MGCGRLDENQEAIEIFVAACLSLFSSLIIFLICVCSKILEDFSRKILFYISLNSIIRSMIMILSVNSDFRNLCFIFAYVNMVCLVSNVIWALSISITLYMVLVRKEENFQKYHLRWLICAYLPVALLLLLPYITNSYGVTRGICALDYNMISTIWDLILVYLPSWFMIFSVLIIYIKLYYYVKKSVDIKFKSILIERGMIYSILIALAILPVTIWRTLSIFYSSCGMSYFRIIALSIIHMQGVYYLIAVTMNNKIRKAIILKIYKRNHEHMISLSGESFFLA